MALAPAAPAQIETTPAPLTLDREPQPTAEALKELIGWRKRTLSIQQSSLDRTEDPETKTNLQTVIAENEKLCRQSEQFITGNLNEGSIAAALNLAEFYEEFERKCLGISTTPEEYQQHKRKSLIARAALKYVHLVSPRPKPVLDQK